MYPKRSEQHAGKRGTKGKAGAFIISLPGTAHCNGGRYCSLFGGEHDTSSQYIYSITGKL